MRDIRVDIRQRSGHAEVKLNLIDVGVNLTHDSFDADRDAVIAAAGAVGVRRMIVTGTTVAASVAAAELAGRHEGRLFSTAGIHPHHASECDLAALDELKALAANGCVVAIGECGLDYYRNFSPAKAQRDAFVAHLRLAVELAMPVFLHQRDAHEDFLAILRDIHTELRGGVAHCFTGGPRQRDAYLELDLHIGVTGWVCDERRGSELVEAVPGIPPDRLLVETDAPYLLPRTIAPRPRSRRNEPAMLPHIVKRIAELQNTAPETIAAATTANAERFFTLPRPIPTM